VNALAFPISSSSLYLFRFLYFSRLIRCFFFRRSASRSSFFSRDDDDDHHDDDEDARGVEWPSGALHRASSSYDSAVTLDVSTMSRSAVVFRVVKGARFPEIINDRGTRAKIDKDRACRFRFEINSRRDEPAIIARTEREREREIAILVTRVTRNYYAHNRLASSSESLLALSQAVFRLSGW